MSRSAKRQQQSRLRDGKPLCNGHSSRTGKPCENFPMRGQQVCHAHGGRAPQNRAAGQRRQEEQAAERAVAVYGLPRDVDPHEALLEEVRRTAGHVAMIEQVIHELERDRLVHGVTETVQLPDRDGEPGGRRVTAKAAINVWLALYLTERKHLLRACETAIRCGVEERRVRFEEQQGQLIARAIRAVLEDEQLGLSPAKRKQALQGAARHLRLVTGGQQQRETHQTC